MQFNRIGTENTREMNIPLLSKYCCLENVLKINKVTWYKERKIKVKEYTYSKLVLLRFNGVHVV